jgi:hypothetical protein
MELSDATEKTPATPGINPRSFQLVAQCLNHYATPGPKSFFVLNQNVEHVMIMNKCETAVIWIAVTTWTQLKIYIVE